MDDLDWNALRNDKMLAAALPASRPHRLCWIGIYPLDASRESTRALLRGRGEGFPPPGCPAYRVRKFEIDKELVDTWVAENDLENDLDIIVFGEEGLKDKLAEIGVAPGNLQLAYKSNYPI